MNFIRGRPADARPAPDLPRDYQVDIAQRRDSRTGMPYTWWVCATLDPDFLKHGPHHFGTGTNGDTQDFAKRLGLPIDEAGHVLASRLGFSGQDRWNIMPIDATTNGGFMRSVEGQIHDAVKNCDQNFKLYIRLHHVGSARPRQIYVLLEFPNGEYCYWDIPNPE